MMRCEVVPSDVSEVIPFTHASYSEYHSEDPQTPFGHISHNGLWMWLVRGDSIVDVYRTEGRVWCGAYCFAASMKNPSVVVTAVQELCSSHLAFPCLLVALDLDPDGSMLCVLNVNTLKVVRAIQFPYKITSLDVVSGDGGACMKTHYLSPKLRSMFGMVALGVETGHVFFLDLCLDEQYQNNEQAPARSTCVHKSEFTPQRREEIIAKHDHACMLLNDNNFGSHTFEFNSSKSTLATFPADDVFVSVLRYIRSLATLAVGYNFGGIHLWNLHNLSLLYTINTHVFQQPIVAFAFQEPENDPRNFCYIWIIRGHHERENYKPETVSVATLYSLTYHRREYLQSFGVLYMDLYNCTKRFEYPLSADPFSPKHQHANFVTRLISCQVICQTDINGLNEITENESHCGVSFEDISLCFMAWESWPKSQNMPSSYYLAVFDLNQWYQAQMPSSFRCEPCDLSPYLGIFSLQKVAHKLNVESLLGLYTIPHSIRKFKHITASEEFFYPSSLGFQIWCFSVNGLAKSTYSGFQRQLLFEMADMAPDVLVDPKHMYSSFLISGLLPDAHRGSERGPLVNQQDALLDLALENHLPYFFMKCMKQWRYSDSAHEGCTSRGLLNWAWKKLILIKTSIDKMCQPLFNCSGCDIDEISLKHLYSYKRQLNLIDSIISGYKKYALPRTETGVQELQIRQSIVFSIKMYLQVLLWLREVHVLPEVEEEDAEIADTIVYPANELCSYYTERRSKLQKIHTSIGSTDVLLVDGLVKEADVGGDWQVKGGLETYPPPSIYAALSCYLVSGLSLPKKHAMLYYLLRDVLSVQKECRPVMIVALKKFSSVFDVSPSILKITKAFWYLDHQDFEAAIKTLLSPSINCSDISLWQHQRIIKSFLFQNEPQKALKYINSMKPPEVYLEDAKLHLSVLLACGAVMQAFDYQRKKQKTNQGEELLVHLFRGCQETRKLNVIMDLPLNSFEFSCLVKYLSENEDPRAKEALIMYHILRCDFFEAAKVNDRLLTCPLDGYSSTHERAPTRNALVEALLATVPKAERKLIEEIRRMPERPYNRESALQPLSLAVKNMELEQVTYSDLLSSLISKAKRMTQTPSFESCTPLRLRPKLAFEDTPFLRPAITPELRQPSPMASHAAAMMPKRNLPSPSANEFASPIKKSRLLDNAAFKLSDSAKSRTPKHLMLDIASLLQTPPICRKSRSSVPSASATPHSILKKTAKPSALISDELARAETPPLLVLEPEGAQEMAHNVPAMKKFDHEDSSKADTPSRQIRFNVSAEREIEKPETTATSVRYIISPSISILRPRNLTQLQEDASPVITRVTGVSSCSSDDPFHLPEWDGMPDLHTDRAESPSDSSHYSSASERSLIVSPRRPLRDASGRISPSTNKEVVAPSSFGFQVHTTSKTTISSSEEYSPELASKQIDKNTSDVSHSAVSQMPVLDVASSLHNETLELVEKSSSLSKQKESSTKKSTIKSSKPIVFTRTVNKKSSETTYEDFCQSLTSGTSSEKTTASDVKITESSPVPLSSAKPSKSKTLSAQKPSSTKKHGSAKAKSPSAKDDDKPSEAKPKQKAKTPSKASRSMEFTFSEPHSPTGPEVLAAISTPADQPIPTFVFSPPNTRARVRQKKLNETLNSTAASEPGTPPVDPLLQQITSEHFPEVMETSQVADRTKPKKKTLKSTPKRRSTLVMSVRDGEGEAGSSSATRHSMVLRQTKTPKKSVKLF